MVNLIKKINTNKFVKDLGVTTIGQVLIMLLTFLLNKIISIKLGPSHFMEYSLSHKTAGVITYIMILSLGIALPRYLAMYEEKKEKKKEFACIISSLLISFISSFITIIICIFFKDLLAKMIFGNGNFYGSFIFPTLLLSLEIGLTTLLFSYYRGVNDFVKYNLSQILISTLMIFSILLTDNILKLLYFMSIFGILVSLIGFLFIIRRYSSVKINNDILKKETKVLLKYSLPRVPGEFVLFSFTLIPIIIINQRLGLNKSVGYSVATGIITAVTPFYRFVGMVLLPYASKKLINNNIESIDSKIKKLSLFYILLSVVEILLIFVFSNIVITVLYSREYIVYTKVVKIVSLSIIPNSLYLLIRNPLDAISKKPINSINLIISFLIMIVFTYYSKTEFMYSLSFVLGYTVLGVLSTISWLLMKKKFKNNNLI